MKSKATHVHTVQQQMHNVRSTYINILNNINHKTSKFNFRHQSFIHCHQLLCTYTERCRNHITKHSATFHHSGICTQHDALATCTVYQPDSRVHFSARHQPLRLRAQKLTRKNLYLLSAFQCLALIIPCALQNTRYSCWWPVSCYYAAFKSVHMDMGASWHKHSSKLHSYKQQSICTNCL